MKRRNDVEALRAYKVICDKLSKSGFPPKLNVMDNEATAAVKRQIIKSGANHQLAEPNNHQVNAAERAICMWKNHFIAGSCSTDPDFLIGQWDKLTEQATMTLNMLRTSRLDPNLSAHAQLDGQFDYNKTPLAPPGTRALAFEDPGTRDSWAPHGKKAFVIGPAMEHYRSKKFHMPKTNATRITGTYELFPRHSKVPVISPTDTVAHAATELIDAIRHPNPTSPMPKLTPRHLNALRHLAKIF